ncbi:hypothetical protein A1Q1_01574 [Trichosporon asahii var. asahii CBS 2479]|uniref:Zinc finger Mcm10/DnaG-type domain-containing protein n=1 Tax=Trichosporon asahii var. asahii (strain ATCC 90039 / CBS 2479 / JCM 2466 / KCTC 7840 / NBRC 103889/ NCYC 2677 / UAMH 7654) TaxID=1186058 RepID=J6F2E8_TRIAS|nr:hypothetical protein A1Q1_01574 [Trichosporon asahii var. asahii CBS 2479]EJT49372.1 hypothetical protein A1Q1_01574 [Trichosporon asahii var. asahii CBS 2479]
MADLDTTDLNAQIARLQEERAKRMAKAEAEQRRAEASAAKVLIGATPTKAPKNDHVDLLQAPKKSTVLERLAARKAMSDKLPSLPSVERSTSFKDRVASREGSRSATPVGAPSKSISPGGDDLEIVRTGTERAEDLTLDHELELGPREFGKDPEGEEVWRALEPNSGIRLSKRVLPHEDVQDLIRGRFFLRPPQVYSIARLSRDGATYDIPVEGDWVTIAVVAERGDIRVSGTRNVKSDDEDDDDDGSDGDGRQPQHQKRKKQGKQGKENKKRKPRKYINLKLVALPPRNKTLGSNTISGDAHLQLLLFESDSIVNGTDDEGNETRSYRGGSGGAYEKWCNLGVGSVIALLNPRVLRPLKAGGTPHPLTLPLALNPASADCISYIGQAMDMGRCTANQRDGSRCRTWIDLRLGQVCEYHIHAAVKRGRSGRGALAGATTAFELTDRPMMGRRGGFGNANLDKYDPSRKTGLLPRDGARAAPRGAENGGGGATYIVGSGVARIGRTDGALAPIGDPDLANKLGRNTAMKRKRKMEVAEAEAALSRMFEKNGDGTSAGAKYLQALGKAPTNEKEPGWEEKTKRVYSAQAIKNIGFDPTGRRNENAEKRLASLASLRGASNPKIGRGPGPKRLSNVVVPVQAQAAPKAPRQDDEEDMIDLD